MRDIKFRGKSIDSARTPEIAIGERVYGYLCAPDQIIVWDEKLAVGKCVQVDPETVGQFTGKLDKNDKEIYGGDKWKRGDFIAIVVFKYSQWKFETAPESKCIEYPCFYSNVKSGEIIGDIHTTPELMEQ